MLYTTGVMAVQFTAKILKFSLPWQQGSPQKSFTDTIKSADPENPLLRASTLAYLLHKL